MKYFVYQLVDPRNDKPFYIGKGCRSRPNHHLNENANNTTNMRKYNKIQSIRKDGLEPIIEIVQRFENESDAYALETELISNTSDLTNLQPGGVGGFGSPTWKTDNPSSRSIGQTYEERYGVDKAKWMKEIRSKKLTGRVFTDESKGKMSESAKKRDHTFKQKQIHTPDGVFSSMSAAAKYYNRAPSVITTRVNSDKYPDYYFLR